MTTWNDVKKDPKAKKCLDHGFIVLMDKMGDDSTITQSARVSYGKGTKKVSDDRGLIRYLLRHKHTTPFEMVEFRFLVKLPIFVARQWIRHRTACLAGDNILNFDLGSTSQGVSHYPISVEDFYNKWYFGTTESSNKKRYYKDILNKIENINVDNIYTIRSLACTLDIREPRIQQLITANKIESKKKHGKRQILGSNFIRDINKIANEEYSYNMPLKSRIGRMRLRQCNEDTNKIQHTNVVDIWQNGIKPVYELELENGNKIQTTKEHLFFTSNGWLTLESAINLCVNSSTNEVRYWSTEDNLFANNGQLAYQNKEWLQDKVNENLNNKQIGDLAGCSKHTISKWIGRNGIKRTKKQLYTLCSLPQIGRKRPKKKRGPLTGIALENIQKARSGAASNFWKGGVNTRDTTDDNKWYHTRTACFERDNYICQASGLTSNLEAHHIEPRYKNSDRIFDVNNTITLSRKYHQFIHSNNLEDDFELWIKEDKSVPDFFETFTGILKKKASKLKKESYKKNNTYIPHNKLTVVKFSKIKNIKYIGEKMTYDLEVEGPHHNFSCNKFIVHNSVNEYSGRYSEMSKEFYIPEPLDCAPQSSDNKQGREGNLSNKEIDGVQWLIDAANNHSYDIYETLLGKFNDKQIEAPYDTYADDGWFDDDFPGLARELARMVLPLNNYTEWYWKIDLHNLLRFLSLRNDSHAQKEIRVYAQAIEELITPYVPLAMEAFKDYVLGAGSYSRMEAEIIQFALQGKGLDLISNFDEFAKKTGMSMREIREFRNKWGI